VFFFGTITGLNTQVDVLISLMKSAFSNLCNLAAIALCLGSSNHRRGCLTSLAFGSTLSVCSKSSLGTPGMSEGHQAKISQCSWRNSMSVLSYIENPSLLQWRLFLLGPWDEPTLSMSLGLHRVGGMTPGRIKRLERYRDYGWLYASWPSKGLAGI
jgi:hypothetical protein